jgi:hypothetical protein
MFQIAVLKLLAPNYRTTRGYNPNPFRTCRSIRLNSIDHETKRILNAAVNYFNSGWMPMVERSTLPLGLPET